MSGVTRNPIIAPRGGVEQGGFPVGKAGRQYGDDGRHGVVLVELLASIGRSTVSPRQQPVHMGVKISPIS
jgi:hypothetical protein